MGSTARALPEDATDTVEIERLRARLTALRLELEALRRRADEGARLRS